MNIQKFLPQSSAVSKSSSMVLKTNTYTLPGAAAQGTMPLLPPVQRIDKKVNAIVVAMRDTYAYKKKKEEKEEKETQRAIRKQREDQRESERGTKKPTTSEKDADKDASTPGFLDRIFTFAGFTLAGFLVKDLGLTLTRIGEAVEFLTPIGKVLGDLFNIIVDGTLGFIDLGYQAYSGLESLVTSIGGEGAAEEFNKFSDILNKWLNYTLILGYTFRTPKPKPRPPGSGAGAGLAAGFAAGLAVCAGKGVFGGSPAMAGQVSGGARVSASAVQGRVNAASMQSSAVAEMTRQVGGEATRSTTTATATGGASGPRSPRRIRKEFPGTARTGSAEDDLLNFLTRNPDKDPDSIINDLRKARQKRGSPQSRAAAAAELDMATDAAARERQLMLDDEALIRELNSKPQSRRQRILNRLRGVKATNVPPTTGATGQQPTPRGVTPPKGFRIQPGALLKGAAIGAIIDLVIKLVTGEDPGRAIATSAGGAVGGVIGGILGGLATTAFGIGTGGLGAFLGPVIIGGATIAGATLFEYLMGLLYDGIMGALGKPKGFAGGGISRELRQQREGYTPPLILTRAPQVESTLPGKSVGGPEIVMEKYADNLPKMVSDATTFKSRGLYGSIAGIGVDHILGQRVSDRSIEELSIGLANFMQYAFESQYGASKKTQELGRFYKQRYRRVLNQELKLPLSIFGEKAAPLLETGNAEPPISPPLEKSPLPGKILKKSLPFKRLPTGVNRSKPGYPEPPPGIPDASDPYIFKDGTRLEPGMEVGSRYGGLNETLAYNVVHEQILMVQEVIYS